MNSEIFTPAIRLLDLQQVVEIASDIRDFLGVRPHVYFSELSGQGIRIKGEFSMAELREGQQFDVTVALKTKAGHPAKYQTGTEAWESSNPPVSTVKVDPANPLRATVKGLDGSNNEAVLITFTCDGDPDDDASRDVVATLDVVVTQGEAFVAEATAGPATDTP